MQFVRAQGLKITTDRVLLENASFTLSGRTGIVGDNGSGKSTLLRALASSPRVQRSAPVSLLAQEPDRTGTVADYLCVSRTLDIVSRAKRGEALPQELELEPEDWSLPERLEHALSQAGLRIHASRPLSTLSGGEMARLAVAALALKPGILLLDEPTNHLDQTARNSFYDFVQGFPGTLVIASHDRSLLGLMETILELRPPEARVYGGSYDFYSEERAKQRAAEQAALRNARRVLRGARLEREETLAKQAEREKQGRRRAPNAGIPKVLLGRMKRRAEQTRGRLATVHDERVGAAIAAFADAESKTRFRRTVRIEGADREQKGLCALAREVNIELETGCLWQEPLTLSIRSKARIWLAGDNGTGKSSLARLLMGFQKPSTGIIRRPVRTAMVSQEGELWLAEAENKAGTSTDPGPVLALPPRFRGRTEMSGGERMHALLRQALEYGAGLLMLDEPTNHLDLERTGALAESLRAYSGALLVITHDADFAEEAGLLQEFSLPRDSVDARNSGSIIGQ